MNLKKLKLSNFKGIKEFELDANGENVSIYGDNATGKTTIVDAFMWLLFNKNSENKTDFNIKTLDKNNEVIHGLEHTVLAVLEVNSKDIELKKTYKEKWIKKRGQANKELTSHTTEHWIDEVPVKKKEYDLKISEILDENIFKLITNPLYFNTQLKWQERRKLVLEIAGDIEDLEVVKSNLKLKELAKLLEDKTIEEIKKVLAERRKKYNKALEQLPIRIDELIKSLPVLDINIDYVALKKEKADKQKELEEIEKKQNNVQKRIKKIEHTYSLLSCKKSDLKNLEESINNRAKKEAEKELNEKKKKLDSISDEISAKEFIVRRAKSDKDETIKENQKLEKDIVDLRENWAKVNSSKFIEPNKDNFICPTCKQKLPSNDIETKKIEMKDNFEEDKKTKLDEINVKGKKIKEQIAENKNNIAKTESIIEENQECIDKNRKELSKLEETIKNTNIVVQEIDFLTIPEWKKLSAEIKELEKKTSNTEASEDYSETKRTLQDRIEEINSITNNKEIVDKISKRLKELDAEEKELNSKLANAEKYQFLTEEFTKTKVDMLEENINKKFELVKFKMFKEQVNGGLEDVCETTINGVPYSDLNNAMRINAGLDIIKTLCKFYDTTAPIFVDNAEAVTKLIDIDSQIIRLVVSEKDKKLRVEE